MKTSVIGFSRKEMGKLAHALLAHEERQRDGSWFFSHQDEAELAYDEKRHRRYSEEYFPEDAWRRNRILDFMDHLWVANQVAYHLQYREEMDKLELLDRKKDIINGALLNGVNIHRELCSVRYNLYTNGGTIFLGPSDMEKLDHLINSLAEKIVRSSR